jgi:hypothetical protein
VCTLMLSSLKSYCFRVFAKGRSDRVSAPLKKTDSSIRSPIENQSGRPLATCTVMGKFSPGVGHFTAVESASDKVMTV